MRASLLLLHDPDSDGWETLVAETLAPWGDLYPVLESGLAAALAARSYDFMLIDALAVKDVIEAIPFLRSYEPRAKIIVVTSSPTWQRARDAIKAGATDYIRKSFVKSDLLADLMPYLENET